jgi:hypothetical protein
VSGAHVVGDDVSAGSKESRRGMQWHKKANVLSTYVTRPNTQKPYASLQPSQVRTHDEPRSEVRDSASAPRGRVRVDKKGEPQNARSAMRTLEKERKGTQSEGKGNAHSKKV